MKKERKQVGAVCPQTHDRVDTVAEHTKLHLWFNTIVSLSAAAFAGAIAYNGWNVYSLNIESVGFTSRFTYDCPISFGFLSAKGTDAVPHVGLCWTVTVANQSNIRISVIRYVAALPSSNAQQALPSSVEIVDANGKDVPTPIIFDSGEARTLLIRASVPGTILLKTIIDDFVKTSGNDKFYLSDLAYSAAQSNFDVLGNPIETHDLAGWGHILTFPANYKQTIVSLKFNTGRNNTFSTQLIFPRGTIDVVTAKTSRR
jgi:hypothetical protein